MGGYFKKLELHCSGIVGPNGIYENSGLRIIHLPNLEELRRYDSTNTAIFNNQNLEEFLCENVSVVNAANSNDYKYAIIYECPKIRKIVLGRLTLFNGIIKSEFLDLIHFEIGEGTSISSLTCSYWNPVNAMKTNEYLLIEDPSICANNLEQFLYNFREYVVKRLAVRTSRSYIYLSSKVKKVVLGEDESHYAANWIVPGESDTYLNTLNDLLVEKNLGIA